MAAVLVNHTVNDYNSWLKAFEAHEPARREAGVKAAAVWQAADNPNNVFILMEYENRERIERFAASEDLKQAMLQAGVKGAPAITHLGEVRWYRALQGAAT